MVPHVSTDTLTYCPIRYFDITSFLTYPNTNGRDIVICQVGRAKYPNAEVRLGATEQAGIPVTARVKGPLSGLVIAPACLGSCVLSGEIYGQPASARVEPLVALTVATLLLLLGADVTPEDLGARELKGVERPVRFYCLSPEAAG
jgi:hypothetical protein